MSKRLRQAVRWPEAWERPFESTASLLAKMRWINPIAIMRFEKGAYGTGSSEPILLDMLSTSRTGKEFIPDRHIDFQERARIVYCVECLKAGFHSRVPQCVGLNECPIHYAPFKNVCPLCMSPIYSFGRSDFRYMPVYLCPCCAWPLASFSRAIWANWPKLTDDLINKAFLHFMPGLEAAQRKLEGYWNVHAVDYPYIYYYLTGYVRTDLRWASTTSDTIHKMKHVAVAEYRFPKSTISLEEKIESITQYDERALMESERVDNDNISLNGKVPVFNNSLDRLDVWIGMDCLNSALSLRSDILSELRRARVYPYWIRKMCYEIGVSDLLAKQITLLSAAHSLDHIFYQLTILKMYCEKHYAERSKIGDLAGASSSFLKGCSGNLYLLEKNDGHFVFRTSILSWLPSFQLKLVNDEIVLRVFRALPRPSLNLSMELKEIKEHL